MWNTCGLRAVAHRQIDSFRTTLAGMPDSTDENWMALCSQAAQEQDPKKLYALVDEINRLLKEKQGRVRGTPATPEGF